MRGLRVPTLLLAVSATVTGAQDVADQAWRSGDVATARRLYAERLAADSSDERALHRMALMDAWDGRYDSSLRLFDRLLAIGPNLEAEVDRARVLAWRGHPAQAARMLTGLLRREPGYIPALEARAEFLAWAGELREAVTSYEHLAEILPGDRSVRSARARILAWASRLDESIALYDSLVRSDPGDRDARLGLGRALGWAGRLDSAGAVYAGLIAHDSTDADAWVGLAQTQGWAGRLRQAERTLERALAADSSSVPALAALAQTLRWQGREAAADGVLRRAEAIAPTDADVRTQRRWVDAARRPRAATTATYESDSDGSGIFTLFVRGGVRARPRLDLRPFLYLRWLDFDTPGMSLGQQAWGGGLEAVTQLEPGWTLGGSVGLSGSDADTVGSLARWGARASAPGWWPVIGTVAVSHEPLDATAQLVRNGVVVTQANLDLRASPPGGWTVTGAFSVTAFEGSESNRRTAGAVGVNRPILRALALGMNVRVYGFAKNLTDGYFDPAFYLLAEIPLRWERTFDHWTPAVEVAPGLQKIAEVSANAAIRLNGSIRYAVAPGREIVFTGGYSTLGLSLFAESTSGYRYRWISLAGSWGF